MKNFKSLLLICMVLLCAGMPALSLAESPQQVLDKAVAKLNGAKSVDCRFSVTGGGHSASGTLAASGRKFRLATPQATTWFDGDRMWTANKSTKEITLVKPTDSEVRESNPFAYIDGYKSEYNVFFSKRKDAKRHLVLLNPKNKKSEIKAVEIAINKTTLMPERFIIRDRKDNVTTIVISSLTLHNSVKQGEFACPVNSMTDYELIDLR